MDAPFRKTVDVAASAMIRARSKRSLDATKWNRGPLQNARDRVGGSLDDRRRRVIVEKSEPLGGRDWQKGTVVELGVVGLAACVATLRLQATLRVPLGFRGLLS